MAVKHEILILENSSLFRNSIKSMLEKEEFDVIGEISHWEELFPILKVVTPNLLLLHFSHQTDSYLKSLYKLKKEYPHIPVLLVMSRDYAASIREFIRIGINGFIYDDTSLSGLIRAIEQVTNRLEYFPDGILKVLKETMQSDFENTHKMNPKDLLTPREIEVCRLFCNGLTYKEIGAKLNISPRTVETHKKNILAKLQIKSLAGLVKYAVQNQLV